MKRTLSVSNSVIHPWSLQHSFVITNAVTTVAHTPITARVRLRRPFNKVHFFSTWRSCVGTTWLIRTGETYPVELTSETTALVGHSR